MTSSRILGARPVVTVIISTYNWSNVLPYSIGSVLRQTFSEFELLVIGDGCTDDSADVVNRFTDPRVHWVNLPHNSGSQSGPNNEGIRRARGKFIAYLGHDDLWLPHHLEALLCTLEKNNADLTYGYAIRVKPDGAIDLIPKSEFRPSDWLCPTSCIHSQHVAETVGKWRDPSDLYRDIDVSYFNRIHRAGFRFAATNRLTCIKIPAVLRQNVYKDRPCHEQKAWTKHIVESPDTFEIEHLIRMAQSHNGNIVRHSLFWQHAADALRRRGTWFNERERIAQFQKKLQERRYFKGLT